MQESYANPEESAKAVVDSTRQGHLRPYTSEQPPSSAVNHPSHYTFSKYEVLDVLQEWFPTNPLLWQVAKYIARAKHKGKYLEDLKKARFYLDKAISEEEEALNAGQRTDS